MEILTSLFSQIISVFLEKPTAQAVGFVAYCFTIYTFAFCKEKKFLIMASIFSGIWTIHFGLLGAGVAAAVNFVDVFKNYYAVKHSKNLKSLLFFASLYVILGYFFFQNIYSLIPLCSSIIGLFLAFYARGVFLNLGYLIIIMFWFVYNLENNSLAGIASDITLFFAGVYGIITMFVLKKSQKQNS